MRDCAGDIKAPYDMHLWTTVGSNVVCARCDVLRCTVPTAKVDAREPRPFTASEAIELAEACERGVEPLPIKSRYPRLAATLRAYAQATGHEALQRAIKAYCEHVRAESVEATVLRVIRAALKEGE